MVMVVVIVVLQRMGHKEIEIDTTTCGGKCGTLGPWPG